MGPKLFRVGRPGAPVLRVRGMAGYGPAPLMVRGNFSGLGSPPPGPSGQPGSALYPYSENELWGDGSGAGGVPISQAPVIGADQNPSGPPQPSGYADNSTPIGESDRPWTNPTTYSTIPINASYVGSQNAILAGNFKRSALIIQNTSSATSPDVAPTLYVDFNHAPQIFGSLALPPGLGFFWGASDGAPRDSIFVAFGASSGGTVVVSGCVVQGTYDPNPTQPLNPGSNNVYYAPPRT